MRSCLPWIAFALITGCASSAATPAPAAKPRPTYDVLLGGERKTGPIHALVESAPLAPGEAFKIIEVGRDASSSHHIVQLRGREPVHRHDAHDLLVYTVEGEGPMLIGAEERWVGAGSIVYVPRGTVHSMHNTSATPMIGYAVFTPPFDGKDRVPAPDPLPATTPLRQ